MPAKADPAAAAADTSEHILQVIERSTAASKAASDAATASTEAMRQALLSLPDLLANALTKAGTGTGAGAVANANPPIARTVTACDLRDRKVPDFWEHNPKAWFVIFKNHVN